MIALNGKFGCNDFERTENGRAKNYDGEICTKFDGVIIKGGVGWGVGNQESLETS